MERSKRLLVLFGNQLFSNSLLAEAQADAVFMAESDRMCRAYRAHKHKLVLVLSAMRSKADALRRAGVDVHYIALQEGGAASFATLLTRHLSQHAYREMAHFETESKVMEGELSRIAAQRGLHKVELPTPMFLTPRPDFLAYQRSHKRLFMADFYKWQRKRLGILLSDDGKPTGAKWSFDDENRKKLPKGLVPPALPTYEWSAHTRSLVSLVEKHFAGHPGECANFWLPTTEAQAERALAAFLEERFELFGDYEDALSREHRFVFHSVLSPLLNLGLLTPARVVEAALAYAEEHDTPLNSLEGFVRQVIGWREFIRGIWNVLPADHWRQNFWGHEERPNDSWYTGDTGVPPLDDAIRRASETGYGHHIERLMVVGNMMLLCRIAPDEAYRWFMEMYVDSAPWVMAPNVYGMALFSEGGAFTTKPYICGSNYLRKMSDYGKGPWCDVVDGLYWSFVDQHRDFFARNPRSKMMLGTLDRIAPDRRERIFKEAESFRARVTA